MSFQLWMKHLLSFVFWLKANALTLGLSKELSNRLDRTTVKNAQWLRPLVVSELFWIYWICLSVVAESVVLHYRKPSLDATPLG